MTTLLFCFKLALHNPIFFPVTQEAGALSVESGSEFVNKGGYTLSNAKA